MTMFPLSMDGEAGMDVSYGDARCIYNGYLLVASACRVLAYVTGDMSNVVSSIDLEVPLYHHCAQLRWGNGSL